MRRILRNSSAPLSTTRLRRGPPGLRQFLWVLLGFFAGLNAPSSNELFPEFEPSHWDIALHELMQRNEENEIQQSNSSILSNSTSWGIDIQSNGESREYNSLQPSMKTPSLAIFYHTFSGPLPRNKALTTKIVNQQFEIMGQAATESANEYNWTIYYRSVGEPGVVNEQFVDPLCKQYNLTNCVYQGHSSVGHEELSLQALHQHCQKHPSDTVVYVHTKGSLHEHQFNRIWRGPLTTAAMKSSCFESFRDKKCNVCGLQFYPIWNPMIPGNMWSSPCSYIRDLKDPLEYRTLLTQAVNFSANHNAIFQHEIYKGYFPKQWDDILGIDRYSNEAWVTSHPTLLPCDISRTRTGIFPQLRGLNKQKFARENHADVAPRVPLAEGDWFRFDSRIYSEIVKTDGQRPHEWFLLAGILYRHRHIYSSFPPWDSWFWSYYPNGEMWRERVQNATAKGDDWPSDLVW